MAEEIIINASIGGSDDINKLTNSVDKLGTEVTDTAKAFDKLDKSTEESGKSTKKQASEIQNLRKEIREAKSDMLKYSEGTNEYGRALRRASDAQFKLKDANDKTRAAVMDFGQTGRNVAQSVAGLAGGFSVLTGAMSLFGIENDATLQAILKVQAAMSIATGIGQFADSLDNMKDLFAGFKASGLAAKGAVTEISDVADTATNSMSNLAKETSVVSSNLVGGVGAATINKNAIDGLTNAQKAGNSVTLEELKLRRMLYLETDKSSKQSTYYKSELDKIKEAKVQLAEAEKVGAQATEGATTSVGKQLLTMGLWVAAAAAVVIAIGYLISKMYEIPKDLEIKLKLTVDSEKATAQQRELVAKIQHDLLIIGNKQDKNTEKQLKNIKDIMVANGIANTDQLKGLTAKELADSNYFKNYLKKVENAAFDEALIKERVAARVKESIGIQQQKDILKTVKDKFGTAYGVKAQEKYVKDFAAGNVNFSPSLAGEIKKWNQAVEQVKEAKKEIETLNNIGFKGDYLIKPEKNTKITTSTKEDPELVKLKAYYKERSKFIDGQMGQEKNRYDLGGKFNITDNLGEINTPPTEDFAYKLRDLEFQHDNLLLSDVEFYKKKIELRREYGLESNLTTLDLMDAEAAEINSQYDNMLISYDEYLQKMRDLQIENNLTTGKIDEEIRQKKLADARALIDSVGDMASSMSDLSQVNLDITNKEFDAKIAANEESMLSDNEKQANSEKIELQRYEALKKDFEAQKKWKEAQAWMDFASGSVGIWSGVNSKTGVVGMITAGIQQAALLVSTIASVKTIRAQTLDKPKSASGSSTGGANITPNKTALTSSQENLNTMSASNQSKITSVVKVSDIDKVQNDVSVRDNNSKL